MNKFQLSEAYAALVKHYDLKAKSRDLLDRSDDYLQLMQLTHEAKWATVEVVMSKNSYFRFERPDASDPVFELVG